MTAEVCLMVLVLAVVVASFGFDLHAYLVARRPARHADNRPGHQEPDT